MIHQIKEMYKNRAITSALFACLISLLFSLYGLKTFAQTSNGSIDQIYAAGARGNEFEHVNLYNGHLTFKLPLGGINGRGSSSVEGPSVVIEQNWFTKWFSTEELTTSYPSRDIIFSPSFYYTGAVSIQRTVWWNPTTCSTGPYSSVAGTNRTHTGLVFTKADGTKINLRDDIYDGSTVTRQQCTTYRVSRGTIFKAEDDSGITFISDTEILDVDGYQNGYNSQEILTGVLKFKDGTTYRFNSDRSVAVTDRNGNQTTITDNKITDNLNREITTTRIWSNPDDPTTIKTFVNYPGIAGAPRQLKIHRLLLQNRIRADLEQQVKSISNLFPGMSVPSWAEEICNPLVISSVELPDGRQFKFFYNNYAELARVEFPQGGAVEYDHYPEAQGSYNSIVHRRLKEKRVYPDGGIGNNFESKTSYAYWYGYEGSTIPTDPFASNGRSEITIETRDVNSNLVEKSKHYFYGNARSAMENNGGATFGIYRYWKEGQGYKTEVFDTSGSGNTVLRRVETTWSQNNVSWWNSSLPDYAAPPNSPKITQTKTTYVDSGQISRQVFGYDQFNNRTDIWEYYQNAGAQEAFFRRQHIDYVTDSTYTSHTGAHLRSLPLKTWISSDSNGNNKVSVTDYEYDNYTPDTQQIPPRHAALLNRMSTTGRASGFDANYVKRGNVTKVTGYANASNSTESVSAYMQYDVLGNLVKTIDPKGYAIAIDYTDNFGLPDGEARTTSAPTQLGGQQTFAFPTKTTNPLGHLAYVQYDYFTGKQVNAEDANGIISKTVYSGVLDRATQAATAIGTGLERQTTTNYDDVNHKVTTTSDFNSLGDNALKIESIFDGLGRITETREFEASGGHIVTKTQYDALGRAFKSSNPYRPSEITSSNPVLWTSAKFDPLSRVTEVEKQDGSKTFTTYDGNVITTTDQSQKQRRLITDALERVVRVDEPVETFDSQGNVISVTLGSVTAPAQSTSYSYDELGNLKNVTQGNQVRTFVYDSLSRLKSAAAPESGTTSYTYDANSNLLTKTDARGVTTSFSYDELNRSLTKSYTGELSGQQTAAVTYFYDGAGLSSVPAYSKGQLTKISSSVSETRYTEFNALGAVISSEQVTEGRTYQMGYSYNLAGRLASERYPSGRIIRNNYSTDGNLTKVANLSTATGARTFASNFSYTSAGALERMQLGNGRWETARYNKRLQVTQIGLGTTNNIATPDLWKVEYEYGKLDSSNSTVAGTNNGNISKQKITVPSTVVNGQTITGFTAEQNYVYDSLNRLTSASENLTPTNQPLQNPWKQTYQYDRYGNRQFKLAQTTTPNTQTNGLPKVINPEADPLNNRLKLDQDGDNQSDYLYDAAGNMTKDATGKTYSYDAKNKLKEVKNEYGVSVGQYFYDGAGQRVKKITGSYTTIFVYDASGSLVAEYSTEQPMPNPETSYLTSDNLDSPRVLTDQTGKVTARRDFLPFGEELTANEANRKQGLGYTYGVDKVKQRFTGYERDGETELDFAQARYYNSKHGRFTSADPLTASGAISHPQTWNRYNYVSNNPLNMVDPTGLFQCDKNDKKCKKTGGSPTSLAEPEIPSGGSVTISYYRVTDMDAVQKAQNWVNLQSLTEVVIDLGAGASKGFVNTLTFTFCQQCAPKPTDSLADRVGQGFGTVIGELIGVELTANGLGGTLLGVASAQPEIAVPAAAMTVTGVAVQISAAKNMVDIITTPIQMAVRKDFDNFDQAREDAFKQSGMDKVDPEDIQFSKEDSATGTVTEFKGPNGEKVAYDSPHADMDKAQGHDKPHVGWQSPGKRNKSGFQRGNNTYKGSQHPSRPNKK
jgi:RHS repeat-associated protein